ncbi:MAG: tetratricopeptide repeat protein [Cyanothece sp. SIO1E1]|nr:tetratricopeptide repeat protein [Cyanothece sp. SIO1E1]
MTTNQFFVLKGYLLGSTVVLATFIGQSFAVPSRAQEVISPQTTVEFSTLTAVPVLTSQLDQARTLFNQGDLTAAIATYQAILQQDPNNSQVKEELALTYAFNQDYDNSIQLLQALVTESPQALSPQLQLAEVYSWQGDYAAAIARYELILDQAPENLQAQLGWADILRWQGQDEVALAAYNVILSEDADNLEARLGVAQILSGRGQHRESLAIYESILAQAPDNLEAQLGRTQIWGWQGQYPEAIAAYEAILRQDPDNLQARLGFAQVLGWSGQYDQALNAYEAILAQDTNNLDVQLAIAQVLSWQGEHEAAIAAYDAILEQMPDNLRVQLNRAEALGGQGNHREAIAAYESVLEQMPNNLKAQMGIAQVLSGRGKFKDAIAAYTTILEQEPENLQVKLKLAEVTAWSSRFKRALAIYEEILQQHPDTLAALQGQAQVNYWLGRPRQAIELYQAALTQFPQSPELRLGLAKVYASQERVRKATEVLQPLVDERYPEALELIQEIRAVRVNIEFQSYSEDSDQSNWFIEQTDRFRIGNGRIGQFVKTGLQTFEQDGFEDITITSIKAGVEGNLGRVKLTGAVGVDLFDRLAAAPSFNAEVAVPVTSNFALSGILEQGPYKVNVETLENSITALRVGPDFSWQIDRNTDWFASVRWGDYNDGNQEFQFFSRLERRLGNFFIAGNVFTLSFAEDPENGYFAPSSFVAYGGELGWEGAITDFLRCRFSVELGSQVIEGDSASANTYQARCNASVTKRIEAGLGYRFTTLVDQSSSDGDGNRQTISGQLRFLF